jgi:acetyl-CoA carboxylase carboxyl transferase subunit alpha
VYAKKCGTSFIITPTKSRNFVNLNFLDFEQPIAELEAKIEELRYVNNDTEINISDEIARLQVKCQDLTRTIFSSLTPWQISQLARHPQRPYLLDYVDLIFTDFEELHGDRVFGDDPAMVGDWRDFGVAQWSLLVNKRGVILKKKYNVILVCHAPKAIAKRFA